MVPTLHFVISEGLIKATTIGQIGWLFLMATLYITGACLYAARIPERFFPGKCDIWVSVWHRLHVFLSSRNISVYPRKPHLHCLYCSFTPISCSTSWWSLELLFTFTAFPTSRSFATPPEEAVLTMALFNTHPLTPLFTGTTSTGKHWVT